MNYLLLIQTIVFIFHLTTVLLILCMGTISSVARRHFIFTVLQESLPASSGRKSSRHVNKSTPRIIDKSGLPYKVTSMCTLIEGEWSHVIQVINKARMALRRRGHDRIYINITVDDRKVARGRLTGKVASVEKRLGREVNK